MNTISIDIYPIQIFSNFIHSRMKQTAIMQLLARKPRIRTSNM